ncbi:restriction endonuclease subunit S [bacterium]|nr:restriction endonuclease subunit S [bacterium]
MKLNTQDWKEFKLSDYFDVKGSTTTKLETLIDDYGVGKYPYVTTQATNNGVAGYYNCYTEEGNILVADSAVAGYVSYQPYNFSASDHVEKIVPKSYFNKYIAMFLVTVLNQENYRYSYGRKFNQDNIRNTIIKLPAKQITNSDYIPDWQFMEDYIQSLHHKPITTKVKSGNVKELDVNNWEEFKVSGLFNVKYGINMELNTCIETTSDDPEGIAFVARTAENNGVSAYVKRIEGKEPQPAETITVAGGGSVLSTFVQKRPFYSGRDLYLLIAKENINLKVKMFISTVLFANQYRYSYGRQANKTLPDLILKLPIQRDSNGNPVIDDNRTYSDNGYIPDWQFMGDYINSLPYSDRI